MTNLTGTRHGTARAPREGFVSGHARPTVAAVTTSPVPMPTGTMTAVSTDTCPAVTTDMDTDTVTALVTDTEPQLVTVSMSTRPANLIEGLPDTDTRGTVTTMTMTTTPGEGRR